MPTTGGAVSLMERRVVDFLWEASRGSADGFIPIVPDTGRPATNRSEWYVAAIEQAVLLGDEPFRVDLLADMDASLDDYRGVGVDWGRIHTYATHLDSTVLPQGGRHWSSDSEPLSVLAFCGEDMRARVAWAGTSSLTDAPPAPSTNIAEDAANLATRLARVEARHEQLKRMGSVGLLGLLILFFVALGTAHRWEKVDVPRQPATFRTEKVNTGIFTVTENGMSPCYVGQDWTDCINDLVREYNQACTRVSLDFAISRWFGGTRR